MIEVIHRRAPALRGHEGQKERNHPDSENGLHLSEKVEELRLETHLLDRVLVHGDDQPCPWRIHGLKADLPPWWRLHALEYVPGLARAVFFHWPGGGHRRDQVLVLRRYACATRLLAGTTPEQWLTCRLDPGEEVRQRGTTSDGIAWADGLTRGDTLWRRLRRQRQHRRLHVWVEAEEDRLVVQEWKGTGEPLPPLRSARSLNDVGLAGRSPPCERT